MVQEVTYLFIIADAVWKQLENEIIVFYFLLFGKFWFWRTVGY